MTSNRSNAKTLADDHGNTSQPATQALECQVLVYGGTVSGIAAALASARMGCQTILVERGDHFGGMTSSGLGLIDTLREEAFGGIVSEFLTRVRTHYRETYGEASEQFRLTYGGYFMEPHIAQSVIDTMLADQPNLRILKRLELVDTSKRDEILIASRYKDRVTGDHVLISHSVAIDGTYEGDLAASAGVECRIGREGRSEYGEQFAGVIYYDWRYNQQAFLPESTGEASDFIQAYCFRMTLSDDAGTRVPIDRPASYDDFLPVYRDLLADFGTGRIRDVKDVLWLNPLPNRKYCLNGHIEALTSANWAESCVMWPEADWAARDTLYHQYKEYTEGLIYFLQNDPRIHKVPQVEVSRFGLPADEYPDNNHFPWQLYVRQGRRIIGEVVIAEHDSIPPSGRERPVIHKDAICTYEHRFDCHPCRNRGGLGASSFASDGFELLEGTIFFRNRLTSPNRPATIPYRSILPRTVEGLLVPAALSATHVAFTAIRMEPVWMVAGQAAGVAAALAISNGITPRQIDIHELQVNLVKQGQVLVYFNGLRLSDPDFEIIQLKAISEDYPSFDVAAFRAKM